MEAVVADDGRVTIPQVLREKLGIKRDTVLDFREENGALVVVKVLHDDPLSEVIGCLKSDLSSDEIMAYIRGPI